MHSTNGRNGTSHEHLPVAGGAPALRPFAHPLPADLLARPSAGPPSQPEPPLLIDLAETARRLSLSLRTIERLADAGELPLVRVGRRRLVHAEALADWARRRVEHPEPPE